MGKMMAIVYSEQMKNYDFGRDTPSGAIGMPIS